MSSKYDTTEMQVEYRRPLILFDVIFTQGLGGRPMDSGKDVDVCIATDGACGRTVMLIAAEKHTRTPEHPKY